jgi:uncharacterized protein (TIGR02646 family)
MIRLTRLSGAVPASLLGAKKTALELLLLQDHRSGTHSFKSATWTPAKKTLKKESSGKCAYCESPTGHVAHGDVEHFRPKSVYWWMAYWYGNYSFSCQICNQTHKGDSFPTFGSMMVPPVVTPTTTDAALGQLAGTLNPDPSNPTHPSLKKWFLSASKENAGIPDPYDKKIDPEDLFAYEADDVLQEVRVIARSTSLRCKRALQSAEQHLGLNREELCRLRYLRYEVLAVVAESLPELTPQRRDRAIELLRKSVEEKAEWAGMARYFLFDDWKTLDR